VNEEQKKMRPLPTGLVQDNIWAINNLFVNFFILKKGEHLVAIDTGANPELSVTEMGSLGFTPDQINTVLLTHSHGDHTALLSQFTNATVYAFNSHTQVAHGDKLSIAGMGVEVIHTPGHKSDHVGFLVDGGIYFAGDMMSVTDEGKVGLFNEVYNEDSAQQAKDIEAVLARTDIKTVITAHYGILHR